MRATTTFPVVLLLGSTACVSISPKGTSPGTQREFVNPMDETVLVVKEAVRQSGLIVINEGALSPEEWALDARNGEPAEAQIDVRVTVSRVNSGSRVTIDQVTQPPKVPNLLKSKRTTSRDYVSAINRRLDQKLKRKSGS